MSDKGINDQHTTDPYMPTDAEWAAYPDMIAAATDSDGEMWLFEVAPAFRRLPSVAVWLMQGRTRAHYLRTVKRPRAADTTLRYRPANI